MKQYIRFKSTTEINNSVLKQILSTRFPAYDTYIKNGVTYVRKNAVVKVKVKYEEQEDVSLISVGTIMPWWGWIFIGWIVYVILKRGVTDEVYSALKKDLTARFPYKFNHLSTPLEAAQWKLKSKPLATIGFLLLCLTIFSPIYYLITPSHDDYIDYYHIGHLFFYVVGSVLWFLMGLIFTKLPNIGKGKIAGYLLEAYAVVRILTTFTPAAYWVLLPYSAIRSTIFVVSGILIYKAMMTGASKRFCKVMIIFGILDLLENIYFQTNSFLSHGYVYIKVIDTYNVICSIILFFLLDRALFKMRHYPIEKPTDCISHFNNDCPAIGKYDCWDQDMTIAANSNSILNDSVDQAMVGEK